MPETYYVTILDETPEFVGVPYALSVMNYVAAVEPAALSVTTSDPVNPDTIVGLKYDPATGIFSLPPGGSIDPAGTYGSVTIVYFASGATQIVTLNVHVITINDWGTPSANQIYTQDVISFDAGEVTVKTYNKGYYPTLSSITDKFLFIWPLTGPFDQFIDSIDGANGANWASLTGSGASTPDARFFDIRFAPPPATPPGFYLFAVRPRNTLGIGNYQGVVVKVTGSPDITFPGDITLVVNSPTSVTATWSKSVANNTGSPSTEIDYTATLTGRTALSSGTMRRIDDGENYSFTWINLVPAQAYTCNVIASDITTADPVNKNSNTVVP